MEFLRRIMGPPVTGISSTEAQARLKEKNRPFLLDVRQPEEFRDGHIAGAQLIPLGELQRRLKELPNDREILCVCQSGSRSISATRMLQSAGYQAANLNGGMIAWRRAGLPVKKGT